MSNFNWEDRLVNTVIDQCKFLVFIMALVLLFLIIDIIVLLKTRQNNATTIWNILFKKRDRKSKYTLKQQIMIKVVILILVPLWLCLVFIIPAHNDIEHNQYVQITTTYHRKSEADGKNLFSNGHVYIEIGNDRITLDLPSDWTHDEFPVGTYSGTVCYAKESGIILAFSQDRG